MSNKIEKTIIAFEERLKVAMLKSDIDELDQLLASDLIFTNHLGEVISKADDMEFHKSGDIMINSLELSEELIKPFAEIVTVSVRTKISGYFRDEPFNGDFRFTRIWCPAITEGEQTQWQVVVAHSCLLKSQT